MRPDVHPTASGTPDRAVFHLYRTLPSSSLDKVISQGFGGVAHVTARPYMADGYIILSSTDGFHDAKSRSAGPGAAGERLRARRPCRVGSRRRSPLLDDGANPARPGRVASSHSRKTPRSVRTWAAPRPASRRRPRPPGRGWIRCAAGEERREGQVGPGPGRPSTGRWRAPRSGRVGGLGSRHKRRQRGGLRSCRV